MKVIEGDFGKSEVKAIPLRDAIQECLEEAGLSDTTEGQFVMVVNGTGRMTFITNERSSAECACLLEVAHDTIMQKYVGAM